MEYHNALRIAVDVVELLKPFCERIAIAGSVRRKRPICRDIEIVTVPKPYEIGLFEDGIASIVNRWEKVKGNLQFGKCKYTQRVLPSGIKLDLFFVEEGNFGIQYAIRTGSAYYSYKVLACGWVKAGYHSDGGYLYRNGTRYEVREEKDLFKMIGVKYIEPELREW